MRDYAPWHVAFGFLTLFIGIFRTIKNRQSIEPDELTVFSWFLAWPIYLPIFIIKAIKNRKFFY